MMRKKEKKIKKEEQVKRDAEEKVKERLRRAVQPQRQFQYGDEGYFDNCF